MTKITLRSILERQESVRVIKPHSQPNNNRYRDWGDAPDISTFFGRETELALLEQWILNDRHRVIAIVGMRGIGKTQLAAKLGLGGIGKTDLSLKLVQSIQDEFEYVIWRSLLNAPA